ncbi:SPOR domain-containing protein [Patescibacteria group bacterium]|nr:SPOR domain-containing protein [Patescibacteria group bacterium]MBU4580359.1 SPOR domain-containing protein [Patescibacteria group bacterium]
MTKNPENLDPEFEKLQEGFSEEEKELAEKYSKSVEKQSDDFGFAEKEKEEKYTAELREKFNEMAENTLEEKKKILRGELMKEEAERLEKAENEQIEKEALSFNNDIERDQYTVLRNSGLVKSPEQFADTVKLLKTGTFFANIECALKFLKTREEFLEFLETKYSDTSGREILYDFPIDNFKLFVDFYQIDTPQKFKEFLNNEHNCEALLASNFEKLEFMADILDADQFKNFLREEGFRRFLKTGNQDVLKDYLDFNKIKNPEEIQKIFTDGNLEYILFSEAKPENSKYIFSNFIKTPEDIKKAFEKNQPIEALVKDANIDNLKYVIDLYQINTLDGLENLCGYKDDEVRDALRMGNLENIREFAKFCGNPEEFKKICNESDVGYGLLKTKSENFAYLIESGIIDKNNLFYLRSDWVNRINSLVDIDKNNEDEFAFLKRIKDQHPDAVYNTLSVLADYKDKNQDSVDIGRDAEGIFEILDKLGGITLVIYDKIRKLNKEEGNNYAENIKERMKQVKEKYGAKDFNANEFFASLADFVDGFSEADFKILCSDEMVKKINKLGGELDLNKDRTFRFLLNMKDNMVMKKFLKDEIVFSEVKGAPASEFSETDIENNRGGPTLYGRQRETGIKNITDYATFGREDREPYMGWEYIAAARSIKEKDIDKRFAGNQNFEKTKEKLEYVKKRLPDALKIRLDKVFGALDEWGKEGLEIEKKNQGDLVAGSYVKFDDSVNIKESFGNKIDFPAKKYNEVYDSLDKSFKSASWVSIRVGSGIETLYDFMTKDKKQFEKESRNLEYLSMHQKELSENELQILKDKSKNILNSLELIESVYNTPKGVYFSFPPLHGGTRGEDARDWMPRSYALRDRIYYKTKISGKENFTNVKEYHLAKTRAGEQDDLKIRLYSFSSEADQKKLGQLGMAIEVERNSKTKFLDKKEAEDLLKQLKVYTLPTLYLKDFPLLKAEEKK